MPAKIQVITGPARCGKTQRLLEEYREWHLARRKNSPLGSSVWIAPNRAAVGQLQESLVRDATALLQPNLFTFASFAELLIVRSRRRVRGISSLQKRRLLQHVIQAAQEQKKLDHFVQVASTPGFVTELEEFVAEQKRSDVWPDQYERWSKRRPSNDRRSRELARLYKAYQQQLRRGDLYDAEGRFWLAREILAEAKPGACEFELVVVSGFNDFTTAQFDILRLLAEHSSQLSLSLLMAPAADAFEDDVLFVKPRRTLDRLREIIPQVEIEHQPSLTVDGNSLARLRQAFVSQQEWSSDLAAPIENIEILAASSELGEIEAVAERIKNLLLKSAARPHDIVVVSRGGSEGIAALIAAVFPDYGIPYASELRPRLESEPLLRALQGLLRLHQEDWPFQALLQVTNNRLLWKFDEQSTSATSYATRPRVAIEECLRSAQLPGGRVALLEQLEHRGNITSQDASGDASVRAEQTSVALESLRQLDEILSTLPTKARIRDWTDALELMLTELGALSPSPGETSRTDTTWKLLRNNLREIQQVEAWCEPQETLLTIADLQELIAVIAREVRVPASHDSVGHVWVLTAESARKLSTKHLFLIGLEEQAFSNNSSPQQAIEADGAQPSGPDDPDSAAENAAADDGRSDAPLLFYELVTRPTKSLTLSYPSLDAKGQPLAPSPLLTELEHRVGEGKITRRVMPLGQGIEHESKPYGSGNFRRQSVAQALSGKERWLAGMLSQPQFVRNGSAILSGIDCIASRSTREAYGTYEGLIAGDTAKGSLARRFNGEHLWSPSQLESYAACPFRFFSEQILKLESLNELTLQNDPRRRGSLLHHVLATVHEQLTATDVEFEARDLVQRFLDTLESTVTASPLRGIEQSLREIERREIEAWAPNYAEQETSYRNQWKHLDEPPRPAHFEVRFGPETKSRAGDGADPASTAIPFELDLGDERICLTGQIDRVDIGRVGGVTVFNIIDYKSGREVKLRAEKVQTGHQLQLPLYALAAEQLLLADQRAVALATGYWNIQGKGFDSKRGGSLQLRELADQTIRTSEDWKELQPAIIDRVQQLIRGIRSGDFPVYNEDEHCTRSCSLSTICRVAQIRNLEKVWPPVEPITKAEKEGVDND